MIFRKKQYIIGTSIDHKEIRVVLLDKQTKNIKTQYTINTPQKNIDHFFNIFKALISPIIDSIKKQKNELIGMGISLYNNDKINIPFFKKKELIAIIENNLKLTTKHSDWDKSNFEAEIEIGAFKKYKFKKIYNLIINNKIKSLTFDKNKIQNNQNLENLIINFIDLQSLKEILKNNYKDDILNLLDSFYRKENENESQLKEATSLIISIINNSYYFTRPEAILLSSNFNNQSDIFFSNIKKKSEKLINNNIKIFSSKLGKDAIAIGAALNFLKD